MLSQALVECVQGDNEPLSWRMDLIWRLNFIWTCCWDDYE